MTTAELIALIDSMYPSAFTSAQKVAFMNMAQNDLSRDYGTIVESIGTATVADKDYYSFPTGLTDISQIIALGISNSATPINRYDYTKYDLTVRDVYPDGSHVYFQTLNESGEKKLVIAPMPEISDLVIMIRFRKPLTALSSITTTTSPDFDSNYHRLLAFYACYMICSTGASPDTIQADRFLREYESLVNDMWKDKMRRELNSDTIPRDNKHWHANRGYVADLHISPT